MPLGRVTPASLLHHPELPLPVGTGDAHLVEPVGAAGVSLRWFFRR